MVQKKVYGNSNSGDSNSFILLHGTRILGVYDGRELMERIEAVRKKEKIVATPENIMNALLKNGSLIVVPLHPPSRASFFNKK